MANRAVAYAALHQPENAKAEFEKFLEGRKSIGPAATVGLNTAKSILDIEENLVRGELAIQVGDYASGIESLKSAVAIEDQLNYDEPPDWIQPVRHTLGVALLRAGKPTDAVAVYEADLKRNPHNGWSLLGLSQAYAQLGKPAEAARYRTAYAKVWSKDDEAATSSCRCLPGTK